MDDLEKLEWLWKIVKLFRPGANDVSSVLEDHITDVYKEMEDLTLNRRIGMNEEETDGFLAPDQMQEYLWSFVHVVCPEAYGKLTDFIDDSLEIAKSEQASRDSLSPAERYTWLWKFVRLLHPEAEGELVDLVEDAAKKIVDLMQQEPSSHFAIEQEVIKFMENERMTSCVFKDRIYRGDRYRLKVEIEIIE